MSTYLNFFQIESKRFLDMRAYGTHCYLVDPPPHSTLRDRSLIMNRFQKILGDSIIQELCTFFLLSKVLPLLLLSNLSDPPKDFSNFSDTTF